MLNLPIIAGTRVAPGSGSGFTPGAILLGAADGSIGQDGSPTIYAAAGEDYLVVTYNGRAAVAPYFVSVQGDDASSITDRGTTIATSAGSGFAGSGATAGTDAGNLEFYGGDGGDGTASALPGRAGYVSFAAGFPGANGGAGGRKGGDFFMDTTAGTGAAAHGDLYLASFGQEDSAYDVRYIQIGWAGSGGASTGGQVLIGIDAPVSDERLYVSGKVRISGAFACNGNTPQAKAANTAAATDPATTQALANALRTIAINFGFMA